jgi:hypothetical protein
MLVSEPTVINLGSKVEAVYQRLSHEALGTRHVIQWPWVSSTVVMRVLDFCCRSNLICNAHPSKLVKVKVAHESYNGVYNALQNRWRNGMFTVLVF